MKVKGAFVDEIAEKAFSYFCFLEGKSCEKVSVWVETEEISNEI
jgi:hypothetical protein